MTAIVAGFDISRENISVFLVCSMAFRYRGEDVSVYRYVKTSFEVLVIFRLQRGRRTLGHRPSEGFIAVIVDYLELAALGRSSSGRPFFLSSLSSVIFSIRGTP
jgi:hypothetical protein